KMTARLTPEAVHRSALVIDTHADTPQRFLDENYDLGQPLNGGNLNLESARKGNLGAEFFSIWVEPNINKGHYAKKTLELIDSPKVPHTQDGLTEFGKAVVYEMNKLGMMVDISHVSDRTFFRTLIITRAPVIASHSSARALCDAPRNMTDDMLRAVAHSGGPGSKGGVVPVNFYYAFISQLYT